MGSVLTFIILTSSRCSRSPSGCCSPFSALHHPHLRLREMVLLLQDFFLVNDLHVLPPAELSTSPPLQAAPLASSSSSPELAIKSSPYLPLLQLDKLNLFQIFKNYNS